MELHDPSPRPRGHARPPARAPRVARVVWRFPTRGTRGARGLAASGSGSSGLSGTHPSKLIRDPSAQDRTTDDRDDPTLHCRATSGVVRKSVGLKQADRRDQSCLTTTSFNVTVEEMAQRPQRARAGKVLSAGASSETSCAHARQPREARAAAFLSHGLVDRTMVRDVAWASRATVARSATPREGP